MPTEKRQTPRLDILAELQGQTITLDEPITIRQVSAGGLTIESRSPLPLDSVHDFRLTYGSYSEVIRGRVLHRRVSMERDNVAYVSGIQFVEASDASLSMIRHIIEAIRIARPEA